MTDKNDMNQIRKKLNIFNGAANDLEEQFTTENSAKFQTFSKSNVYSVPGTRQASIEQHNNYWITQQSIIWEHRVSLQ